MTRIRRILGVFILFAVTALFSTKATATHIVGAELFYVCTDSVTSTYDLTLKLYRDCLTGQAQFDQSIDIFVFDGSTGTYLQTFTMFVPPQTPQLQPDWDNCLATAPPICVEEGIYTRSITLPPNTNGYYLAWARCCRNQSITNLINPLGEGITFLARVPGQGEAACNSMPQFNQVPPIFLCANQPFSFDHSATDPDGDSLVYAITNPYTGTNFQGLGAGNPNQGGNSPVVDPFTNPMGPPPYTNVVFAPGYTFNDPFGSNNFNIDPQTGFITVTPNQTGIFVYSISVFEYRNGVLLSENRRDFQIHILGCLPPGQPPSITTNFGNIPSNGDTIFVSADQPFCYDVTVTDPIAGDTVTAYAVSAAFGNGTFFPPAATFNFSGTNPIQGQVCWTPACAYDGQLIPLVIGAKDIDDCENFSDVLDTTWVSITAPTNAPPSISVNTGGLTVVGDTIFATADQGFCYDFTVNDPNPNDVLTAFTTSPIFNGPNPPSFTFSGNNPLTGQICWTPGCDLADQVVEVSFAATDVGVCNQTGSDQNTYFIKVQIPPNAPPGISTNLAGNTFSNDTIFIEALDNLCFDFLASDPDVGDVLTFQTLSPIFSDPNGPTITTNGSNPLGGTICWSPGCQYDGQVIPLIFGAKDPGVCNNVGEIRDTVYVQVNVPPNAPPLITPDLTGLNVVGDTIVVIANQSFCYDLSALDPNAQDTLNWVSLSPIFNSSNPPFIQSSGSNPSQAQVCWTPSCDRAGGLFEFNVGVIDNGICSSQLSDNYSIWVRVLVPPNDPPTVIKNFGSLNVVDDTVFVDALENVCYDIFFNDINSLDTLTAFTVSTIFGGSNPATFNWTGINPLSGQVCWTPTCDDEGSLVEIIVGAVDNGDCDNELQVFDTVYVKVSDPVSVPPIVGHDLTGNNFVGDTVYIEIGDSLCYDFYVADQNPDNGIDYTYEFQQMDGTVVNVLAVNVIFRNDSILGNVCFQSDCSNGGSFYRLILTGTDKETCPPFASTSDTVVLKVNTDFKSFAGRDTFFCEGSGGVQLNVVPIGGQPGYFYSWGCDDPGFCGLSNPYIANPIVNPTNTTTYFVQITDANGCTSEFDEVEVVVRKQPIVDAGPNVAICEDGPGTQLQASIVNPLDAPGPYVWTWTPAQGLNNPNIPNPRANPDTSTVYTLVVASANGCNSSNTTLDTLSTVEVLVNERPVVDAGRDTAICFGDEAILQGFASKAGPDYTYIWTPNTGLNDTTLQSPAAGPALTTTYFFIAESNGCPSVADSVTITVHPLPTLSGPADYEGCWGDTVQLQTLAGGDPGGDLYDYVWTPAAGLSDPGIRNPMASPDSTTLYSVQAISDFGCGSPVLPVMVTVLPTPIANAGPDTVICRGDTIELAGSFSNGGGSPSATVFYEWSPTERMTSPFVSSVNIWPETTTNYEFKVSAGSCSTTDEVLVTVSRKPQAIISADSNRICQGEALVLRGSGGLGSASYSWSPAAGLDDPNAQAPEARPDTSTTYTLTVSEGVCSETESFRIEVNPSPQGDYIATATTGCAPLTVHFAENMDQATSFVWTFGDESPLSNDPAPVHTYQQPGIYPVQLVATAPGGCETVVALDPVVVTPKGTANFTSDPDINEEIYLPSADIRFTDLSAEALTWFWDFGDGEYSSAQNPAHTYREAGAYQVTLRITDQGGCLDSITYGPYLVVEPELFIPNVFTPNGDGSNDAFVVQYTGKESFEIQIFDRWGRMVFNAGSYPAEGWSGKLQNGAMAEEGVYYYSIRVGGRSYNGNVTLLR